MDMNNRIEEQLASLRPYSMVTEDGEALYTLTEKDITQALTTIAEEARLSGYADGYKQGRFDAEMDRLNSEEPASNNK